jgi:hypothetical protein
LPVEIDFDYIESHGLLSEIAHMDDMLQRFVRYIWEHPKIQVASVLDKKQLLADLRRLLLTHLAQANDK